MTDEEMAKEYAKPWKTSLAYVSVKEAYLAGLEAGKDMAEADLATVAYMQGAERYKPKWHDLRKNPNDLPLRRCIDNNSNVVGLFRHSWDKKSTWYRYDFEEGAWCQMETEPIAWCEIPKFEEK